MLNLRGQVLPVVDPRPLLGLPNLAPAPEQRLVLLRASTSFLIWVDAVEAVVEFTQESLSEVPAQQASALVRSILRLDEAIVQVLEPAALDPRGALP